ncbi:MAG: hypothetical protein AABZ45_07665 [Pseudomonadota bacterium]
MMADPTKATDTKGKGSAKDGGASGGKPAVPAGTRTAQKGSTSGGGGAKG